MPQTAYQYEIDLVANIVQGSVSAETELIEKYQAGLQSMLRTRCQDTQIADEVMQESWLVILRKLRAGDLKDARRLSGFVTQVVRNQLTMSFRKNHKLPETTADLEQDLQDTQADPARLIQNKELGNLMAKMLNEMSRPRDREMLLRFYYYGNTKAELCSRFGLSSASFDAILARARSRFKKTWKKNE